MSDPWTISARKTTGEARPVAIILAADQADGHAYADHHGHWPRIVITPRSIAQVRGRVGPVYATRKARLLASYPLMRDTAAPCGHTLPRTKRDRRIA
ncbi:MAG: hypothetical protein D3X82_01330 [Candidatus Leucobacter sulfamidivorax]|nr:hypothetical protein [Candidatus Leucobacter sulfamidivorax]